MSPICSQPFQHAYFGQGDLVILDGCDKKSNSSNLNWFAPPGTHNQGSGNGFFQPMFPGLGGSGVSLCIHSITFCVKEIEVFKVDYDKNELPTDEPTFPSPQSLENMISNRSLSYSHSTTLLKQEWYK